MKKNNNKYRPHKVSWAEAFKDITIVAMNRGQLPVLGFIFVIILIINKIPSDAVVKLVYEIADKLGAISFLSYSFNVVLILAWAWHAKMVRKMHSNECERVGKEKTKLQQNQLKNGK